MEARGERERERLCVRERECVCVCVCSCTVVRTHKTLHTPIGVGSAAHAVAVPYPNFPQGAVKYKKKKKILHSPRPGTSFLAVPIHKQVSLDVCVQVVVREVCADRWWLERCVRTGGC